MANYSTILGDVSSTAGGVGRAASVVAALAPPAKKGEVAKAAPASGGVVSSVKAFAPGAIGAVAGLYLWKKHRVLGAVAGHAVGSNAMDLVKGDRRHAVGQLLVEGGAVMGSLKYGKRPVLGFVGGAVVGAVVSAFVPGTAVNGYYHNWRNK